LNGKFWSKIGLILYLCKKKYHKKVLLSLSKLQDTNHVEWVIENISLLVLGRVMRAQ